MARTGTDSGSAGTGSSQGTMTFQADGQDSIELPSSDFIADAKMTRDGDNLVLQAPNGETVVIEGYFNADPAPLLQSADGAILTPNLVDAFVRSPMEFAANDSASDESPVGAVEEVKGNATVTRADGTVETITIGTPIYQGDVIETDASGAVNIVFMDETSMAISQNARLAIDEYKYDPATESGTTNFSVLRGLFVFTSGLIGRDDPDDVSIDTPVGSIGIRGTVIAGDINPSGESTITVLEGAIVVKNGNMETVLSEQFQTVTLDGFDAPMRDIGVVPASEINTRFNSIGDVNPGLFSMINDAVKEQSVQQPSVQETPASDQPANEFSTQQSQGQQESTASVTQETVSTPQETTSATVAESAPAPEAPAPAPVVADIVTLTGDTSALPSIETATGQPSGGLTGSTGTTSSTTTSTLTGTSGIVAGAPVSGSTGSPAATTTPDNTVVDPTQQLAPPSVTNPGTTPMNPVNPIAFTFAALATNDIAGENHVIGNITGPAGVTMSSYTITSGNASWFNVVMTGNNATIQLTQAGADFLGSSFSVLQFGNIVVSGQTSDGQIINQTFSVSVSDASAGFATNLSMPNPTDAAIISDTRNDMLGYSITALGDVDGDGFGDFLVAKNTADVTQNMSFVVLGDGAELTSQSFTALGAPAKQNRTESLGFHEGTTVSGIGDFNGDGVDDYILGQSGNRVGSLGTGTAVIMNGALGSPNFLAPTGASGLAAGDQFGHSVSGVGDFNNDGFADAIVGAPGGNTAYFIAGRNTSWTGDLLTGSEAITFGGTATLGTSVAGIGDFNGDGYSDIAVGDSTMNGNDGFAMIKLGNGASSSPIALGATRTLFGNTGLAQGLGQEISSAGDINGDGLSDLMVGGNGNFGRIYFGNTSGNFGSSISLDIPNTYTLTGAAGVGDFNGDGYDDFVVTFGTSTATKAYVVYGQSSMSDVDITYLKNPNNAFEFTYSGANSSNDIEVSGIGDINGDGYDDFALGLPDANGGVIGNGGFAVVYGRNTGNVDQTGNNLNATANDEVLVGNGAANILNDAGFTGVSMRGGAGTDRFEISNTNFLRIDGGGNVGLAHDVLHVNTDLDFSNVEFESISGIEMMEFDSSNQTITLSVENLFNLLKSSDDGVFRIGAGGATTNMNLIFTDNNGSDNYASGTEQNDIIDFLNAAAGGTTNVTSSTSGAVDSFHIGGYTLMIDQSITVDAQ